MAYKGIHRAYATTATTGTGTLALANSSDASLRTFTQALGGGSSSPCTFCIKGTNDFEICSGIFNSGAMTLTRAAVAASSNSNALVSLSAGTRDVFLVNLAAPMCCDAYTGSRTLTIKDWGNINQFADSSPGGLTLPDRASCPKEVIFPFANDGAAVLVILRAGSDTIENSATFFFVQPGERGEVWNDGTRWRVTLAGGYSKLVHGQVRLTLSGGNLKLSPCDGNGLCIGGFLWPIPDAGVTLSPSGLTPATEYNIYAYIASNAVALEASATGSAVDTGFINGGVRVKNGDGTRTLVGKVLTVAGPAFIDGPNLGFVISYFNRRPKAVTGYLTATVTLSGTTFQQFGFDARFLTWSDEAVSCSLSGVTDATGAVDGEIGLAFDGTTPEECFQRLAGTIGPISLTLHKSGLAEGGHACYPIGRAVYSALNDISLVVENNSAGRRPALSCLYRG